MEFTWTIPVAIILAGVTYAVFARYFSHKERMATLDRRPAEHSVSEK
jgi:hypothetical protein